MHEYGSLCMSDLFTFQQLATHTVDPDMTSKRGLKNGLDQNLIN